ncbi:hypothetical protein E2C01_091052 [Portunus trituberculatus]|uniref:Uncharacterized protein n=1 Tax=Portunus trituberculatus TaxID=210409 RepID=A0A5B7JU16_PORTR|nr:hypothetical protein [Portunus trituberculatus]
MGSGRGLPTAFRGEGNFASLGDLRLQVVAAVLRRGVPEVAPRDYRSPGVGVRDGAPVCQNCASKQKCGADLGLVPARAGGRG